MMMMTMMMIIIIAKTIIITFDNNNIYALSYFLDYLVIFMLRMTKLPWKSDIESNCFVNKPICFETKNV